MIWGLRKVVNMHNSQEWHLSLCPGVLQQALNRSSLLQNAAGKDNHPLADEDMEQNQGKMTRWPKMTPENGCLVENVAALLLEHPRWHLQEGSHRCHLSPLKFDASGPNHADC